MSYSTLRSTNLPAIEILQFYIQQVLDSIYRKLSFKQRFKNPWVIEVLELLPRQVFYQWFRAVQNHSTEFERSLHIKWDSAGDTIGYKISFTHLGTFKYHIGEIIGGKENIKIREESKVTGELAKVAFSEEKLAEIVYQIKKGQVSFQLKQGVFNK